MEHTILDSIRKQTEMCTSFAGFFIFHSMGGGTGSGLTTLLMQKLAGEYGKKHKLEFVIYPCPRVSLSIHFIKLFFFQFLVNCIYIFFYDNLDVHSGGGTL